MLEQVKQQQNAYEEIYAPEQRSEFDFHITTDPLTRYLRDRRLLKNPKHPKSNIFNTPAEFLINIKG